MKTSAAYPHEEAVHPIQVVARRTGVSADVIRAWERRYDAVIPERSPTNRRLYRDADIERLRLLKRAIGMGRRIGDVARLPAHELAALIDEDQAAAEATAPGDPAAGAENTLQEGVYEALTAACLKAIERLDSVALEEALAKAAIACSLPNLLENVIRQTMNTVGQRWQSGSLRLCHEHMSTAVIRSFLGARVIGAVDRAASGSSPVLVVTTPDGQRHDIGALMVALVAAAKGWQPLYLGSSTPVDEIAFAAAETSARAVALSICYPADDPHLPMQLRRLRRQLSAETSILVGGAAVGGYRASLIEIAAACPADLGDLQRELDQLRH